MTSFSRSITTVQGLLFFLIVSDQFERQFVNQCRGTSSWKSDDALGLGMCGHVESSNRLKVKRRIWDGFEYCFLSVSSESTPLKSGISGIA